MNSFVGVDTSNDFEKSLYVLGISNDVNKLIISFKDDDGKDVAFTLTKSNFNKLVQTVESFKFGQFIVSRFGNENIVDNELPQVYSFSGVGQSIV